MTKWFAAFMSSVFAFLWLLPVHTPPGKQPMDPTTIQGENAALFAMTLLCIIWAVLLALGEIRDRRIK